MQVVAYFCWMVLIDCFYHSESNRYFSPLKKLQLLQKYRVGNVVHLNHTMSLSFFCNTGEWTVLPDSGYIVLFFFLREHHYTLAYLFSVNFRAFQWLPSLPLCLPHIHHDRVSATLQLPQVQSHALDLDQAAQDATARQLTSLTIGQLCSGLFTTEYELTVTSVKHSKHKPGIWRERQRIFRFWPKAVVPISCLAELLCVEHVGLHNRVLQMEVCAALCLSAHCQGV